MDQYTKLIMELFNTEILILFMGGLFSLLLPAVVKYSKHQYKRVNEKNQLEEKIRQNPDLAQTIGNVQAYVDTSFGFEPISFLDILAEYSLQPLLVVCFLYIVSDSHLISVAILFVLTLFIFAHELWSKEYSDKWLYRGLLLTIWLALFMIFSYQANSISVDVQQKDGYENTTNNTELLKDSLQ